MTLTEKLTCYVQEITGASLQVDAAECLSTTRLPLYLRAMYRIADVRLCGHPVLLAVQKAADKEKTPGEYTTHLDQLRTALNHRDIALVLPDIAAYQRNRLVQKRVPFIVPGRQMYLPMILVDLRERFSRPPRPRTAHVSWPAQVVVLYHILKKPVGDLSLREVAKAVGYSPMALSNAGAELEEIGVCERRRSGRNCHIHFPGSTRDLWEKTESRFRSPVLRKHWIKFSSPLKDTLKAGLSALAQHTTITDDPLPAIAVRASAVAKMRASGQFVVCMSREDAEAGLECWAYDPTLLAEGETVDRLSLHLCLRTMEDERVDKALRTTLEEIPW